MNSREPAGRHETELKQEIERTREQLGQTVDELTAKASPKNMARKTVAEYWPLTIAAVALLGTYLVIRRWSSKHPVASRRRG